MDDSEFDPRPLLDVGDITDVLDQLVDEQSRQGRSLWLMFLDDNAVPLPAVMPIDDIEGRPDDQLIGNLFSMLAEVFAETVVGGSVVLALTGVGATWGPDEQSWADALTTGARRAGVRVTARCSVDSSTVRPMLAARAA